MTSTADWVEIDGRLATRAFLSASGFTPSQTDVQMYAEYAAGSPQGRSTLANVARWLNFVGRSTAFARSQWPDDCPIKTGKPTSAKPALAVAASSSCALPGPSDLDCVLALAAEMNAALPEDDNTERPATSAEDGATSAAVLAKLRESGQKFDLLEHEPTRTSQESCDCRVAAGWKTTIGMGAKAIVIKSKGKYNLLVMSAASTLNKKKVTKAIPGVKSLSFASEDDVFEITGCRPGAVPPFGSCFRSALPTYVDAGLENAGAGTINFNCGLRTLSVQMSLADFIRVENPIIVDIA